MKYGNETIYRTIPWIVLYIYICIVFVYFVYFSSYNLLDIALIRTFVSVCVQSSLHLWVSWCPTPVSHWLRLLSSIKAALFVFAVPLVSCCCISGLVHRFSSFPTRSCRTMREWFHFFSLLDFSFNCLPPFHVTLKYNWTFSRTKLTLNSSFPPTPTERLMQARIDEPLFSLDLRAAFGWDFWEFITLPESQTASKVAQILYLGYFSSCVKVLVSQLPLLSLGSGSWGSGWWISNVLANACRL